VPASVAGSEWIRPANDSKTFTGDPLVTFKVVKDSDVYVAVDDRITTLPSWLSGWTSTGESIDVNAPGQADPLITYDLYKKSYTAGSTVTLGNNGHTVHCLYITIVKADE
jgi:hypothetical protein